MNELIDKPTTHTWVEEAEVFRVLRDAIRRIGAICGTLRLSSMRREITRSEERADRIYSTINSISQKRVLCRFQTKRRIIVSFLIFCCYYCSMD